MRKHLLSAVRLNRDYHQSMALLPLVFFSTRTRHTTYWRDWSSDVCFFFPSRRRHTRYWRDLEFRRVLFRSSGVNSAPGNTPTSQSITIQPSSNQANISGNLNLNGNVRTILTFDGPNLYDVNIAANIIGEIGRASCRERV